jgi:hypothetical protein
LVLEIKTGGLLITAGATTDTGLMVTVGDVTLSDGDPDVSGTGTFSEAVTITTGGLLFGRQPRLVLRSRLVDC